MAAAKFPKLAAAIEPPLSELGNGPQSQLDGLFLRRRALQCLHEFCQFLSLVVSSFCRGLKGLSTRALCRIAEQCFQMWGRSLQIRITAFGGEGERILPVRAYIGVLTITPSQEPSLSSKLPLRSRNP